MSRKYKVKRYRSIYAPSRKRSIIKGIFTLVLAAVLFGGATVLYDPMVSFIKSMKNPSPLPPISSGSQAEVPQSSSQSDPAQQVTKPVTKTAENLIYMPANLLLDQSLFEKTITGLKEAGIQGIVFDLKDAQGLLLYQSALAQVTTAKAVSPSAYDLRSVTARISAAGFTPVGRMYVFKDKTAPYALKDASVKYMGTEFNWMDNSVESGGKPWLNPYSKTAQDYNLAIIGEAMELGVKSIVLDGVHFPTGFSLEKASFGSDAGTKTRPQVLLEFANLAKETVTAKIPEARCWLMLPGISLALKDPATLGPYGGNISAMTAYSDLLVDFMPASVGGNTLAAQLLGLELGAGTSDIVSAMAKAIGTVSGKVTPIIQASAGEGTPAPTKAEVEVQLDQLGKASMASGYLYWSIPGSYDFLK